MKKIVSLVIVITMMLCMFPVSSMTASATTTTTSFQQVDLSGYADGDTFERKENDETVKYTVVRQKDTFESIKSNLTGNYILANDINMEEETYDNCILGNSNPFSGILDGNGFSIYNFSTTHTDTDKAAAGLLAYALKEGSTVKNLSIGKTGVENYITYDPKTRYPIGGLAGTIVLDDSAETTVTISNVHIYCNMQPSGTVNSGVGIGGILGQTAAKDTVGCSVVISDCSFSGDISFTTEKSGQYTYAGGIVGFHRGTAATLTIERCSNSASIDLTNRPWGSNHSYAGGMIGRSDASATINNCENSGTINAARHCGGIVALANAQLTFRYCTNFGNINSKRNAGGILGYVDFGGNSSKRGTEYTFEGCTNHGNVSADAGDTSTKAYAGGIMGYANFGTYAFNNCGNTGDISSSFSTAAGASGILGRYHIDDTDSTFTNCYTTGTIVSSYSTIYAICAGDGESGAAITVTNCVWNNADYKGTLGTLTEESGNNEAKNILAKETSNAYEACVQKSNDNTKIRVLLLSNSATLPENNVVIKVWCGNSGKQFTVPASKIFALESVDAAGETYYGVGGAYIFGAVVTGIPEDIMKTVTDVTVVYGEDYSADFTMTK